MKKLLDKFADGDVFNFISDAGNRTLRLIDKEHDIWQMVCDNYASCDTRDIPGTNGSGRFCSADFSHYNENIYFARYLRYEYLERPKMENKKFYKVVTKDLKSAFYGTLQYKEGEFVYSPKPGTYLYVFDTLEHAEAKYSPDSIIYECECEGIHDSVPSSAVGIPFPDGTRFAYGVKLTNRITKKYTTVPGSKWYFVNHSGDTEVWEETDDGKVKQVACVFGGIITNTTFEVSEKGFAGYKVDKYNMTWYLTRDKVKWEVLQSLLKDGTVTFKC